MHEHARAAYGEFKPFAAHVFEQDGQMQFAASGDAENVGIVGVFHAQGDVFQQFAVEPFANLAGSDVFAFAPCQRGSVDQKFHRQGGFVDADGRQGFGRFRRAEGDTNIDLLDAGNHHDVARFGRLRGRAFQPLEGEHLTDLGAATVLIAIEHNDFLIGGDAAPADAPDTNLADVGGIIQRTDLQLQRLVAVDFGGGDVFNDGVKQRLHVRAGLRGIQRRVTGQPRGVDDGEIQLFVGGAEFVEQIKGVVDDPVRACAGAVNFVDHDNRAQPLRQCLAGDEAGLRHRPFDGIDK